ncbi:hypothetical protein C8Q74DRAFT_1019678 [Fomes fomentarius]|nr:hypothetical protein C8Q74DRAFT_1019678 [Fomes fomentarius]
MSDAAAVEVVVTPPDLTIGALLIGGIVGAIFYGFTTSQGYMYYSKSVKEPLPMRLYIFAIWIIDTVHTALLSHTQYFYFVSNYANPDSFMKPVWSLVVMVLITAVVSFMVRGVFVRSVWQMSYGNPVPTAALGALSLSNLACGILAMIKMMNITEARFDSIKTFIYLNFGTAILADVCIAGALLYYLNSHKTGTLRTNSFIQRVQVYVIGTGFLTILTAGVALVLYAAMPDKFVFLTPFMLWSTFYTNALYTSLNSRKSSPISREMLAVSFSTSSPPHTLNPEVSGAHHVHTQRSAPSQQVTLQRIADIERDDVKYPL